MDYPFRARGGKVLLQAMLQERAETGISLAYQLERSNIRSSTYESYQKGSSISVTHAESLCKVYGLTWEQVLAVEHKERPLTKLHAPLSEQELCRLAPTLRSLLITAGRLCPEVIRKLNAGKDPDESDVVSAQRALHMGRQELLEHCLRSELDEVEPDALRRYVLMRLAEVSWAKEENPESVLLRAGVWGDSYRRWLEGENPSPAAGRCVARVLGLTERELMEEPEYVAQARALKGERGHVLVRFRAICVERGITLPDALRGAGVPYKGYQLWLENRPPRSRFTDKLSKFLGVDPQELVLGLPRGDSGSQSRRRDAPGNQLFLANLNALALRKGMVASRAAELTGLSHSAYQVWATGQAFPKQETLQKLADFFGVTTDVFFQPPPEVTFHEVFVQMCLDRGLEVSEVLAKSGISPDTLELWKQGRKPARATIVRLADLMGENPTTLFSPEWYRAPATSQLVYNLQGLCDLKGVTLEQALSDNGIDREEYEGWERGETPAASSMQRMADYFGVPAASMTGKPGGRTEGTLGGWQPDKEGAARETGAFYRRFMALCEFRGVTPSDVMRSIHVTDHVWERWKYVGSPTVGQARQIADRLGVSLSSILGDPEPPELEFRSQVRRLLESGGEEDVQFLELYDSLPQGKRREMNRYLAELCCRPECTGIRLSAIGTQSGSGAAERGEASGEE